MAVYVVQVKAVEENLTIGEIVKTTKQPDQSAFARTGRPNYGELFPRSNVKGTSFRIGTSVS